MILFEFWTDMFNVGLPTVLFFLLLCIFCMSISISNIITLMDIFRDR